MNLQKTYALLTPVQIPKEIRNFFKKKVAKSKIWLHTRDSLVMIFDIWKLLVLALPSYVSMYIFHLRD